MARSSDSLDEPCDLVWAHVLDDVVDPSYVNSQLKTRRCDESFDLTVLQRLLGSYPRELC